MHFTSNKNERGASDQFGVRQMHSALRGGVLFDCMGSMVCANLKNGLLVTEQAHNILPIVYFQLSTLDRDFPIPHQFRGLSIRKIYELAHLVQGRQRNKWDHEPEERCGEVVDEEREERNE